VGRMHERRTGEAHMHKQTGVCTCRAWTRTTTKPSSSNSFRFFPAYVSSRASSPSPLLWPASSSTNTERAFPSRAPPLRGGDGGGISPAASAGGDGGAPNVSRHRPSNASCSAAPASAHRACSLSSCCAGSNSSFWICKRRRSPSLFHRTCELMPSTLLQPGGGVSFSLFVRVGSTTT